MKPNGSGSRRVATIGIWIALTALGLGTWQLGVSDAYDRLGFDLWHRIADKTCSTQRVALVGIDEESLASRPDEPLVFWTPHFAKALSVMSRVGVKSVGIDMLLTVSPEAWLANAGLDQSEESEKFDRPFRTALGRGDTVLAAFATSEAADGEVLLPNRDYWLALPDLLEQVALTNLPYDDDSVVRRFRLLSGREEAPNVPLAALLATAAVGVDRAEKTWQLGGKALAANSELRNIPFCGPPGTVPVVSIAKLLAPNAESDPAVKQLKDKVVLLAATYHAAQDVHPTPYAPQLMNGAEVHAQIVDALLSGRSIHAAPAWMLALMIATIAALAASRFNRRRSLVRGGVEMTIGVALIAGMSYAAFRLGSLLPMAPLQAPIVFGFVAGIATLLRGSERRRAELKQMFGRYVSDDVVQHLLNAGEAPKLGGESREVTVLFSDIRSFTTISERLEPEMVVEMLNEWFSRVSPAILDAGGTIDKYIGDAVMAVFGAPVSHPDHALRALRAADLMMQHAEEMQVWLRQRHNDRALPPFGIGVGLHTGNAVSGNIGSSRRMEFTTIGDTVNAASRIEGLTKSMGAVVVVSREVVDASNAALTLGPVRTETVKGRDEPLEVMAFLGFEDEGETRAKVD